MKIHAGDIDFDSLENNTYYAVQLGILHLPVSREPSIQYLWTGFDTLKEAEDFYAEASRSLEHEIDHSFFREKYMISSWRLKEVCSLTKFTIKKEKLR